MRKRLLTVTVASLASWPLAAHAEDKTLRFSYPGDLIAMDPHTANETFTTAILHHIYEGLTAYNEELEIIPALATSWELVEPTIWRFKLRENVKFHNGNEFNADDVVFSLNRALDENSDFAGTLASIKSVTKVDDLTVDVETNAPHPVLARELATAFIMDQEWSLENGAETPSNLRTGQPVMHVTGWAAERLAAMTPPGHEAIIHVTLTDDHPWAQAFVVIEARAKADAD